MPQNIGVYIIKYHRQYEMDKFKGNKVDTNNQLTNFLSLLRLHSDTYSKLWIIHRTHTFPNFETNNLLKYTTTRLWMCVSFNGCCVNCKLCSAFINIHRGIRWKCKKNVVLCFVNNSKSMGYFSGGKWRSSYLCL